MYMSKFETYLTHKVKQISLIGAVDSTNFTLDVPNYTSNEDKVEVLLLAMSAEIPGEAAIGEAAAIQEPAIRRQQSKPSAQN
jgi:hypothetical protein